MTARFVPFAAAALLLAPAASRGQGAAAPVLFPGASECAERLERAGVMPASVAEPGDVEALMSVLRGADEGDAKQSAETLATWYTGSDRVAELCPEVSASMAGERGTDLLAGGPGVSLTPVLIGDAAALSARYGRPPSAGPVLSTDRLTVAVGALRPFEPEAAQSMWDSLVEWLRDLLGPQDGDGGGFWDWLRSFTIPASWAPWLIRIIGIVTVLAALAVLVNELRLAGVFSGKRPKRRERRQSAKAGTGSTRGEDWRRAPPRRQPALLLAAIVERLRARGAPALRDSLTHRELVGAAGTLTPPQRLSLETVARAAEQVAFGGWRPQAADVVPVVARGEALLDELAVEPDAAAAR